MGCANSSPLANGAENIMGTAKSAAQDLKHTGEEVINDVNTKITDTVEYVKDTVVGTMHGMGQDLESALKGGKDENKGDDLLVEDLTESKYIPLKEPNGLMENLEDRKTEMMKRVQSLSDEADKMADELIKETEDVIEGSIEDVASKVQNGIDDAEDAVEDAMKEMTEEAGDKTPVHSIDSLKTGTPEPELERILEANEDTKSPSPKPTLMQLEDLEAEPPFESKVPERATTIHNTTQDTKQLIGIMMSEKFANSPTKASSHADTGWQCKADQQLTAWERLADAIHRKPFPLTHSSKSASIESLTTDTIEI